MKKELVNENIVAAMILLDKAEQLNENIGRFNSGIVGGELEPNFKFDEIARIERDGKTCLYCHNDLWVTFDDKVFLYPDGTCEDWQGGKKRNTYKWTSCVDSEGTQYLVNGEIRRSGSVVGRWAEESEDTESDEMEGDNAGNQDGGDNAGNQSEQNYPTPRNGDDLDYCGSWANALGFAIHNKLTYFKYNDEYYSTSKVDRRRGNQEPGGDNDTEPTTLTPQEPEETSYSQYTKELYARYGKRNDRVNLQTIFRTQILKDPKYQQLPPEEQKWVAENIFGVYNETGKRVRSDVSGNKISRDELSNIHQQASTTLDDKMRPIVRQYAAQINSKKLMSDKRIIFNRIQHSPEFAQLTDAEKSYLANAAGTQWFGGARNGAGTEKRMRDNQGRLLRGQQRRDAMAANDADMETAATDAYQSTQQPQEKQQQPLSESTLKEMILEIARKRLGK